MGHNVADYIDKTLIEEHLIQKRTRQLADEIFQEFAPFELTVIPILFGSLIFAADLIRRIPLKINLEMVRVSSYKNSSKPESYPSLKWGITPELDGKMSLLLTISLIRARPLRSFVMKSFAESPQR